MSDLIKTLKSSETGNDVYPNIKPDNIPSDAITSAKISDGSVTTDKLASDSVTTAKIHNGAVTTAKIEDEGVTTAKIDTGAVTSNKLAESSVTGTKINDGAVSYNKLASALKNLIGDKQDKIDSTNKLDADLVNDSTSTNKFVTTAEKTKISDSASVSGNNTFTGNNYFEGVVEFGGDDLEVTFDGDKSYESSSGETFNDLISAKQNKLYQHNIYINYNNDYVFATIINDSNVAFTINSLLAYLNAKNLNGATNGLQVNGRLSDYDGGIALTLYYDNDYLTFTGAFYNGSGLIYESGYTLPSNSSIVDTIIPL